MSEFRLNYKKAMLLSHINKINKEVTDNVKYILNKIYGIYNEINSQKFIDKIIITDNKDFVDKFLEKFKSLKK
jgi:hypothetical protein